MGDCGCADFNYDHVLRLPDGSAVALQLHHCRDCTDALGVVMHHVPKDEVARWFSNEKRETVADGAEVTSTPLVKFLDLKVLRRLMADFAKRNEADYDGPGLVQDALDNTIREAMAETIDGTRAKRAPPRKLHDWVRSSRYAAKTTVDTCEHCGARRRWETKRGSRSVFSYAGPRAKVWKKERPNCTGRKPRRA